MSWVAAEFWSSLAGAFVCAVAGAWLYQRDDDRPGRDVTLATLGASALWGVVTSAMGGDSAAAALAETVRNLAWLAFLHGLISQGGRSPGIAGVRPMLVVLTCVELLHPVVRLVAANAPAAHPLQDTAFEMTVFFRMMVITGGLVLVHNVYGLERELGRSALRWSASALGAVWLCDLNFYVIAWLGDAQPEAMAVLRGLVLVPVGMMLVIARTRSAERRLRPSRAMAFQSLSLLVIGGYLVTMVGAAQSLAWLGDTAPPLAQVGFVFTSAVLALIVLPSGRVRGWMKVTVTKHLFQHRYDYRAEWLRFTQTIGRGDSGTTLEERTIQAIADITDSTAGLLLVPGDRGELTLAARWQWRTLDVPAEAMTGEARQFFEREGFIVDCDAVRRGIAPHGEAAIVPEWLLDEPRAWALVPLLHFERLVGVIVLARPAHERELDWEDFDLLRVAGRQLASYLAEHAGQEALLDASRFDEFNRRIAFVMHDVKNLASQLTLLCRNAERHGDNPAFRADMQITVRNAAEKLNGLIAKLSRYGANPLERMEEIDPVAIAAAVAARQGQAHPIVVADAASRVRAIGNRETLEQVLVHLVQNAIDASENDAPITLVVRSEGLHAAIEVIDSGTGMSPDFVRNRLFKPFVSTKPGGFGIGAFEARELVRAMQGRLDVESREGLGSRFVIRLPLAEAAGLLERFKESSVAADPAEKLIA
ncbi:XrtA/PEP-CTERM system histidine kinase PrsK [Novosphingobium sp. Gsoil 351]|uniref:XrtA/PEP-CTERM system histidine kinase PrsK n=1 Tax=Novosphingobium sp. Gsoil 351 TaxID=2675225 RepID=UPI0012B48429|nr:XrtA/PEP-CTERM system histidine kinase PrsK [Novosphingobium sp. Gsoil 351]QGN53411.1 PEP-CTERM system histidine kinase PrsK [Novosphingobium sp. Gsoil 351]